MAWYYWILCIVGYLIMGFITLLVKKFDNEHFDEDDAIVTFWFWPWYFVITVLGLIFFFLVAIIWLIITAIEAIIYIPIVLYNLLKKSES